MFRREQDPSNRAVGFKDRLLVRAAAFGILAAVALSACGSGGDNPAPEVSIDQLQDALANAEGREARNNAAHDLYDAAPKPVQQMVDADQLTADGLQVSFARSVERVEGALGWAAADAQANEAVDQMNQAVTEVQAQHALDALPSDLDTYADRYQEQFEAQHPHQQDVSAQRTLADIQEALQAIA